MIRYQCSRVANMQKRRRRAEEEVKKEGRSEERKPTHLNLTSTGLVFPSWDFSAGKRSVGSYKADPVSRASLSSFSSVGGDVKETEKSPLASKSTAEGTSIYGR